jgi:putative hydrolase of the HAD superfamily
MTQAIILDWGGVLMRTVDNRPRRAWENRLSLPPTGLERAVFGGPAWQEAQQGRATLSDVWIDVARQLDLDEGDRTSLSQDFWAGDRLDQGLVAFIRQLRAHGLRTALLSNNVAEVADWLVDLGLHDLFDVTVISAQEGVLKPDPAIYHRTLERLGVAPHEAVFVDDARSNVAGAQRVGIVGVRFRGLTHLQRVLASAGVCDPPPPMETVPGIRAVILDWGGVMSPLTFFRRTKEWEERLGLASGTMDDILWGTEWKLLEIGAISSEEFDGHIAQGLGLPDRAAVQAFYQEYYGDEYLDPPVVAAVRELRDRYALALLTNAFPAHAEYSQERYGFDPRAEFDAYVNSAEVGMAKPDPAIYRLTLDRLGVAPHEAVFLDDMVRNTDAAGALGIHTVVFTDSEQGLLDLASLLGHPVSSYR